MKHILYISLVFVLCSFSAAHAQTPTQKENPMAAMKISTTAFVSEAYIPTKYTCDSVNVSPTLSWKGVPAGTKSLALIVEDPDASKGTVIHWVVYDIPATVHQLPNILPDGVRQGKNTMGNNTYNGPCPPAGKPHRYYFKLYALDKVLGLPPEKTDNDALKKAMAEHVLLTTEVMGRYERK